MNTYPSPVPGDNDDPGAFDRGPWVLAAIGAWLASVYWAALTLLLLAGVAFGSLSVTQMILPALLIGLYAWRGFQLWRGSHKAAKSILTLHVIGGVFAVLQILSGASLITVVLQGVKILIHLFGGFTAWRASKAPGSFID